jgi:Uma2 family endonuclease
MASKPAGRRGPARYEDLLTLARNVVGEIVDGELVVSPRPSPQHALATSSLSVEIGGPFQRGRGGPGGWWILFEPELHLGSDVLVPDLAGWRRERMPQLPTTAWFEVAPDWVCKVLSPSTAVLDRTQKQRLYGVHQVNWLWFVDPPNRTVEVLRLQDDGWSVAGTYGGNQKARIVPFDAVEIELSGLWEGEKPPLATRVSEK